MEKTTTESCHDISRNITKCLSQLRAAGFVILLNVGEYFKSKSKMVMELWTSSGDY